MITRLRGMLLEKQPPFLVMEVGGLAYELQASMTTFYKLPELGSEMILHTHFTVREDAQLLYGFWDLRERALFRTLLKVNGIGPKIALAILSSIEPDIFVRSVTEQNASALQRLPGIGKKTAERIIVEMRDRLGDWQMDEHSIELPALATQPTARKIEQDAISALIALGYKPHEASKAILPIEKENLTSEELIRQALKSMNP
jgi:Holliday junction DNA helicase RuvA